MYRKDIELKVVSVEQRHLESLIVFEMDNVSSIVKKINVGQFVQSNTFELNFGSIGKSNWIVLLFLNGQYEHNGLPNEHICVYLKMLNCANPSTICMDVKFQLGSEYASVTMKNQSFCYDNVRSRWIGTKLLHLNEMIINGNRFIQDDTLVLSVHLNEHLSAISLEKETISLENNFTRKRDYFEEIKPWTESSSSYRHPSPRAHTSNQSSADASYPTNRNNFSKNTFNLTGPTNGIKKPFPTNTPIYDSNLNYINQDVNHYVHNEYSDDEENARDKAPASISGVASGIFNGLRDGLRKFF